MSENYNDFACVYDALMSDVDYHKLCSNMLSLCYKHNHHPKLVLDAACGTGSFLKEISNNNIDYIGVDYSEEMLSVARNKLGADATLLCQDLCELDLYGTVDTAFCTLDGLNHITDKKQLKTAISKISLFLEPDGLFVFDVNTIYKHKKILANNTFVDDSECVYLVWQNELLDNNIVNINLDFFVKSNSCYTRLCENFDERAYSENELKRMLKSSGLEIIDKRDFYEDKEPGLKSQKIIYVAKKENK